MEDGASGCVLSMPLEVEGETFSFVALADSSLIVEDQVGEESLEPVANVVERRLSTPYRARGFRAEPRRWVVIADPLDIADLAPLEGNDATLVAVDGERRLVVDSVLVEGDLPVELAEIADDSEPCIISAEHVDEQWWELTIEELPRDPSASPAAHADAFPDAPAEDHVAAEDDEPAVEGASADDEVERR